MSVRQRAVDLLYAMCDKSNAERIVAEMLTYLESADYSIREEMVRNLAVCILTLIIVCFSCFAGFCKADSFCNMHQDMYIRKSYLCTTSFTFQFHASGIM